MLRPLAIEEYFADHEFTTPHLLCTSDVEPLSVADLVDLAGAQDHENWTSLLLGYTETGGGGELRQAIADGYEQPSADDVIVFCGAQEALFCTLNAVLDVRSHVVVATPCWQPLGEVARHAGAEVEEVRARPEDDFAVPVDALIGALRPDTATMVLSVPNNPTGSLPNEDGWQRLSLACRENGTTLLADEVYRLLEHARDPLQAGVDLGPHGLSVGSLSKAYGLPGLRVGWAATRDARLRERILRVKHYTSICIPAPSEALATIALRARETVLARARALVRQNLDELRERLSGDLGEMVLWYPPAGGTIAYPRLLGAVDVEGIAERLRLEHGLLILPGVVFDGPPGHFRIGFGRADFPRALEVFAAACSKMLS